nr:MAG: ORF1 [Torque teno midi virus]
MPFWWGRRRKFWSNTRFRKWGRRRRYKTRRRFKRRKYRRPYRRRRRRRKKVRRKKQSILVRQWQPDSIVLCKIKGYEALLWGAEGTQYLCYTQHMYDFVRPKYPGGGGFAAQLYSLTYLYDQYKLRNNIWTASNKYKDLCRYLKCIFTFYRHTETDFVIIYNRQPPFEIDQYTYMNFHPYMMLQQKHKIILPSLKHNPKGKLKKRKTIKPPKQMLSKWFFQQQFSDYDLVQIAAAACSLSYPRIGCCNENRIITLYCLNPQFYHNSSWAQHLGQKHYYEPYTNIADLEFWSGPKDKPIKYHPRNYITNPPSSPPDPDDGPYYRSIDYTGGWFSTRVLQAWDVLSGTIKSRPLPIMVARYNPAQDDGKGNKLWVTSIMGGHFDIPTATPDLLFKDLPLWLCFWGYWSYLEQKKGKSFFPLHMFVVQSRYIQPQQTETANNYFAFIDLDIINGKNQYESYLTYSEKKLWYPTADWQIKTINAFCECGPYVPKLQNQNKGTWELATKYSFHFKWGGPHITDKPVDNPKEKDKYDVPDTIKEAIQIANPAKNIAATMFHDWDYRRGCITNTAIKRMQENLETDSSLQSDSDTEPSPKKRRIQPHLHDPEKKTKKIQACLLSLCEEPTCQETQETPNILQLIQQQQQQQQQLKHNLLTLIKDIKVKQKLLQLQTGVLE